MQNLCCRNVLNVKFPKIVAEKFAFYKYLRQYLEAYLSKRIESEKNTGNTPYIVLGTLADMEIKLPTVTEQQKIAHDLSILSQKIENETHISELFIQEKKTLLGRMFI